MPKPKPLDLRPIITTSLTGLTLMDLPREFKHKVEVTSGHWPKPSSLDLVYEMCKHDSTDYFTLPEDHVIRRYIDAENQEAFTIALMQTNLKFALQQIGYTFAEIEAIALGQSLPERKSAGRDNDGVAETE